MNSKYGVRENYDIAQQQIRDGFWRVDPIAGQILSARKGWRPIGSVREDYVRVPVPVGGGKFRAVAAHRVIWEYVYGESDLDLTINHKNGNSQDNNIDNLELVPNAENNQHAHRILFRGNGSRNKGVVNPQAKLNEAKVAEIKGRLRDRNGKGGTALAREFGVSPMTISNIKHGLIWKDVA